VNVSNILTIYLKELRDTLRDRRTVISMIVIPTVVMPAIIMGVFFMMLKSVRQAQATVPAVMLLGGEDSPNVRAALSAHARFKVVPPADDWRHRIAEKTIRAAVDIPRGFDRALERGEPATIRIYNYEGEMRSNFAVSEVRRFLAEYREKVISTRLADRGLPAAFVRPFDVRTENVAPPEKVAGNWIGGILPYVFLMLAFSGAMYPALDLTAGEKERGTMETILCSPIARLDLVLGKFFMVLTASLGTVMFSLLSMGLTLMIGGPFFTSLAGNVARATAAPALPLPDPLGLAAVLVMVLPMAVLFSAVLMAVSLFAKSFKEAQSYVSPLVLVVVLPGVIGMLPGIELNARLALVPILNVSLVSKELVSGVWHWGHLALIFGSSCLYAALALAAAVRMFNREDVIFRA
jgi:sodium transport system permease protein